MAAEGSPVTHLPNNRRGDAGGAAASDSTAALAAIAELVMRAPGADSDGTLVRACALIRTALGAEEAYVIRAGDPDFVRVDAPGDPDSYELKQKGYFLVWRALASDPTLAGGLFRAEERRVFEPCALRADLPATHLALLLPSDESRSELLIVRGPWPAGLTAAQVAFATAVRPILAYLVGALLDAHRRQRQREQLQALGHVAAALLRDQKPGEALNAVATALARASGFDWATLMLVDERIEHLTARVINHSRHSATETATASVEADYLVDWALDTARYLDKRRRPLLYPRIDEAEHERPFPHTIVRYFERAHILSGAVFPLIGGGRLLGTLNYSASTPHRLEAAEVESLALLAEQAVLAIQWLQVHGELREANAALARAATHDALTGLPNRTLFLEHLTRVTAKSARSGGNVAVFFIDLDDFKAVNDRFGHETGDRLLQAVAERLRENLRAEDVAARLGGDEFTVVLEDVPDEAAVLRTAERLRAALHQPVEIAGERLTPRASVGFACGVRGRVRADELLRQADLAMYRAKPWYDAQARGKHAGTADARAV